MSGVNYKIVNQYVTEVSIAITHAAGELTNEELLVFADEIEGQIIQLREDAS